MSAAPGASVNDWVCSQAGGTVADPVRQGRPAMLTVHDHDFAVGGDQYRHLMIVAPDAQERAEQGTEPADPHGAPSGFSFNGMPPHAVQLAFYGEPHVSQLPRSLWVATTLFAIASMMTVITERQRRA